MVQGRGTYEPIEQEDIESGEQDPLHGQSAQPVPTRSLYALTRQEIARGIANRFVHSRAYIFLYLGMAALSITTVILSLQDGCPGLVFYILELIINATMITEVSVRFIAFGRRFWKSPFNVMDLILTFFCVITVLTVVFAGCGKTSKEEEILDTLLLIARNVLQFTRLAAVMRQSGQSIFSRPRPIDISSARRVGLSLDLDLPDEINDDITRTEGHNPVVFDAVEADEDNGEREGQTLSKTDQTAIPLVRDRESEDAWARLG